VEGEKMKPKFLFGDIVVVEDDLIGVVVDTWQVFGDAKPHYDVWVRSYYAKVDFPEDKLERYAVRHKELNEEELKYQKKYEMGY
jgi:hypothetical protein